MRQQSITPEKQRNSKASQLLTQEENEQVFALLGRKCQSMCTAVAQVFKTDPSAHSHWKKKHTGVLCFVKDSSKRSYFMRVYCLIKNELAWEHEIYDSIKITRNRPYLLTFEGQDGNIALNFASEEECDDYHRLTEMTIENRNRKRQERRSKPKTQAAPAIPQAVDIEDYSKVMLRNHPKTALVNITPNSNNASQLKLNFGASLGSKDKKRSTRKYNKEDISNPMNFVHLAHVGFDAKKGFDVTGNEDDEMLKYFFTKAGISEKQLSDRETRDFIYQFVESNNVLDSVKSERVEKPAVPPPVPSRHQPHQHQNGTQRMAPPPPPLRQQPPPLPTTTPPTRTIPPSRPPPINITSPPAQAPPPPPPPPPQPEPAVIPPPPPPMPQQPIMVEAGQQQQPKSNLPVIDDARSALMDSIKKGTTLKKIDPSSLSTGSTDSRNDLMREIQQGIELRPASSREMPSGSNRSSDGGGGTDALADALRRALQERGRVIHSSDDDTSDTTDNEGEWDD